MDIYGIKNLTNSELIYSYDKKYREIALKLKKYKTYDEIVKMKKLAIEEFNFILRNIEIDEKELKNSFINLIVDKNSSKYLWILYSKYDKDENYIDKISNIFKKENQVIRGGVNTYKMIGWMAHVLYVYQIINENISYNKEIINFNGNVDIINQVKELHEVFNKLSKKSKFLLKIFALIHDIGVIEQVSYHDILGSKYVEKVLEEIQLNQDKLEELNILIDIKYFQKILEELIKYHTLITSLSSEGSDKFVENIYMGLLKELPDDKEIKKDIPKILMLLAYGDVIAVDESLMNVEKFQRIKDCYDFFEQITNGVPIKRDKTKVAIERIADMVGENKTQNLLLNFDSILNVNNINKNQFIEDMYNIKLMRYTAPLMKSLKDVKLCIKIYYEIFELIGELDGKENLDQYTIIFLPDKQENDFIEQIKNGTFFECIKKMKQNKFKDCTYKSVNILFGTKEDGKYLHVKII